MLDVARAINDQPIRLPDGHGLRLPPDDVGALSMRGYVLEPRTTGAAAGAPPPPPPKPTPLPPKPRIPALPPAPMDTSR